MLLAKRGKLQTFANADRGLLIESLKRASQAVSGGGVGLDGLVRASGVSAAGGANRAPLA